MAPISGRVPRSGIMSELLLVCVPGVRLDAAGAVLRVLLVPRLTGPGTILRDYGLDTWPDAIRHASFELRLRADELDAPRAVTASCRTDVQAEVWSGFFAPDFPVRPYTGQKTFDDPLVDATTSHAEQITTTYQTAAETIADPAVIRDHYATLDLDDPRPPLSGDVRAAELRGARLPPHDRDAPRAPACLAPRSG